MMTDNASAAPTIETAPSSVNPHTKSGISDSEAATMAEWIKQDLASGKMTQAQADRAFAELNTPLEHRGPDTRTDEQKTLDQHFPAAKPEDYRIQYYTPGQEPAVIPKEVRDFDANARGWMADAEFPTGHGNALVSAVSKVLDRTQAMNADQLDQYGADEYVKLQRVYGEALEEKLSAAGHLIAALEKTRPGLKQFLKTRGVGDSATVAALLVQQAERYWARKR